MKILHIALISLTLASCSGQKNSYDLKSINMKMSNINPDHKKADLELLNQFKKELNRTGEKELRIPNKVGKGSTNYFYQSYDGYTYDEYDTKKSKVRETKIKPDDSVDIVENIDEYFDYYESYYSNGNIKSKTISSWLGFAIGMSYQYDEAGSLVKTIDWDEGYTFTFSDVLRFLDKKGIEITRPTMVTINKVTNNNVKTWVVGYPDVTIRKKITYVLNGSDGNCYRYSGRRLPGVQASMTILTDNSIY